MTESSDKQLQRLQQLLSKVKQNLSNQSESPISEEPFFTSHFQDGIVDYHKTIDPCIIWFAFFGPEFDFNGFHIVTEEKLAKQTDETLLLELMDTLKKTWEQVENEHSKMYPRTIH